MKSNSPQPENINNNNNFNYQELWSIFNQAYLPGITANAQVQPVMQLPAQQQGYLAPQPQQYQQQYYVNPSPMIGW